MCQCQCYHPPFAGRRRSTQCQPWYNFDTIWYSSIKLADSSKSRVGQKKWQKSPFQWQKSPFQVTLREKWLFGCFWIRSSRIRACNKLPEAEQLLDLCQYIILFALHFQALICTISWNQWKAIWTCLWTRQVFCSQLTGSDLIFAVSAYGMGKEGQKSSGLTRACLLPVAC